MNRSEWNTTCQACGAGHFQKNPGKGTFRSFNVFENRYSIQLIFSTFFKKITPQKHATSVQLGGTNKTNRCNIAFHVSQVFSNHTKVAIHVKTAHQENFKILQAMKRVNFFKLEQWLVVVVLHL